MNINLRYGSAVELDGGKIIRPSSDNQPIREKEYSMNNIDIFFFIL